MTGRTALLIGLMLSIVPAIAGAHELGRTQAEVSLRDGQYEIDISVDPDALLSALEAYGVRAISGSVPRAERDRRIAALGDVFLARTRVLFNGRPVSPAFDYRPASAESDLAQAPSVVRMRGPIPAGARDFAFSYGLAMGTYAMTVRIGEGTMRTQWIVGAAPSTPVPLAASSTPWDWLRLDYASAAACLALAAWRWRSMRVGSGSRLLASLRP